MVLTTWTASQNVRITCPPIRAGECLQSPLSFQIKIPGHTQDPLSRHKIILLPFNGRDGESARLELINIMANMLIKRTPNPHARFCLVVSTLEDR